MRTLPLITKKYNILIIPLSIMGVMCTNMRFSHQVAEIQIFKNPQFF